MPVQTIHVHHLDDCFYTVSSTLENYFITMCLSTISLLANEPCDSMPVDKLQLGCMPGLVQHSSQSAPSLTHYHNSTLRSYNITQMQRVYFCRVTLHKRGTCSSSSSLCVRTSVTLVSCIKMAEQIIRLICHLATPSVKFCHTKHRGKILT